MSEKNDDIKQLFSHLGLNPNDYQEIRSAPTANQTVSEPPRRWSLLQGGAPSAVVSVSPPPKSVMPESLGAALAAAVMPPSVSVPAMPNLPVMTEPPSLPPLTESAMAQDSLLSLFRSVQEPATVANFAPPPVEPVEAVSPTKRRTDQLSPEMPRTEMVMDDRVARFDQIYAAASKPLPVMDDEPVTRFAPPPSRNPRSAAVPAPMPRSAAPTSRAGAASDEGRLRLALGSGQGEGVERGSENLQDVFRRLSKNTGQ